MLLTRDKFREEVFKRDNHKCVICGKPAKDAHHILERRLFTDEIEKGGYFLDNGASLCEEHHILAETTELSCEEIREKCGIKNIILPQDFYSDLVYDKWGNIIIPDGRKMRGKLFYDDSVQKILKKDNFVKYYKYPRTWHIPQSNLGKDDRQLKDDSCFIGKNVVVSLKMDGEQTTMYNDYIHARSINSGSHPTRNWVKGLWGKINYLIDDNMRICGENLYAKHSVEYNDLDSYFYVFSIWIDNKCLSWKETKEYSEIIGLLTVPVIYEGEYDIDKIFKLFKNYESNHEGFVIRLSDEFDYFEFNSSVAKYVKPEFRQMVNNSHGHWISKKIETNKLKCI